MPTRENDLGRLATLLLARRGWWLGSTIAGGALALLYALFVHQPKWEARQLLSIREEAASGLSRDGRPGRFDGLDSMKTAQETVLELAHSRAVVVAALTEIGPRAGKTSAAWPSSRDVEKAQAAIKINAPNGAEFGKTEVFYLLVRDPDRERAIEFSRALASQLDERLQMLRDRKASSLVEELTRAEVLAQNDLDVATERLIALERQAGSDFAELRLLTEFVGGESNLRTAITGAKNDLRQASVLKRNYQQLSRLLHAAENDPGQLLAAPNELLASQPALQRLKDGLIESQLAAARLQGTMTEQHPLVYAAALAQTAIRKNMHREIAVAIRGIEAELELAEGRIAALNEQLADAEGSMDRLTELRAHYANAASNVRHCDETLKKSQQDLTAARASLASAHAASLLTRLEEPYTPEDPCGPQKATLLLAGIFGGLAAGLGVVVLAPPPALGVATSAAALRGPATSSDSPAWQTVGVAHSESWSLAALQDSKTVEPDRANRPRRRLRESLRGAGGSGRLHSIFETSSQAAFESRPFAGRMATNSHYPA